MNRAHSWRLFRRMQFSVLAVGILVYLAASLDAWTVLRGGSAFKWRLTTLVPGAYLILTLAVVLGIGPVRRAVRRHLWISYRTGFGQSPISVIVGLGLLVAVAGLMVWEVHGLARGGPTPGGAFSGYGAGLGLLCAQTALGRSIETDPVLRAEIEKVD
jgi:hypothetical protein